MVVERLNRRHARVKLPKLGWVRFRLSRSLSGTVVRSATVARDGKHWFVSFVIEDGMATPVDHEACNTSVGVDRGVRVAIATSDGRMKDRDFLSNGERRRALNLQRQLSRSTRGSRNSARKRTAYQAIRARERLRRKDFCAQIAHDLVTNFAVVVIEDLKTKQMTRSAKGTVDQPGVNVRPKSGLNRAILKKGWHQFALALGSASRYSGTRIVTVPPQLTSQRCSQCGHLDPKSRESQAIFRCTLCSHTENADVNAAKNILSAGLAETACQDTHPPEGAVSSKQEPAGNREELLLQPA